MLSYFQNNKPYISNFFHSIINACLHGLSSMLSKSFLTFWLPPICSLAPLQHPPTKVLEERLEKEEEGPWRTRARPRVLHTGYWGPQALAPLRLQESLGFRPQSQLWQEPIAKVKCLSPLPNPGVQNSEHRLQEGPRLPQVGKDLLIGKQTVPKQSQNLHDNFPESHTVPKTMYLYVFLLCYVFPHWTEWLGSRSPKKEKKMCESSARKEDVTFNQSKTTCVFQLGQRKVAAEERRSLRGPWFSLLQTQP